MKYFIGIVVALLLLIGAILGILAIWDIFLVSWDVVFKASISIVIFVGFIAFAIMVWGAFFKKESKQDKGNNAHPIK
ncbi:hypothetical protein ACYSNM_09505 [Myroides sp. LJL116]